MSSDVNEAASASVAPRPPAKRKIAPRLPREAPLRERAKRVVVRLVQGLYYHDALVAAPAMAFHFFLSLVPLLVFLGWVVGSLVRAKGAAAVLAPFFDHIPQTSLAVIEGELERLGGAGANMAPVAVAGFLWLAAGGVHGAMNTLESVVGAERRPWWKKRLMATAWVVGSLLAVTACSWGLIAFDTAMYGKSEASQPHRVAEDGRRALRAMDARAESPKDGTGLEATRTRAAQADPRSVASRAGKLRRRSIRLLRSTGQRVLAVLFSSALTAAALALFYRFAVSHPREIKRRVWPGAWLAVAVWLVVSWGFGAYVSSLAGYAVFYGSLATVAVLLVWFWLTSLAILVGAELNAQLEGMRE